MLTSTYIYEFIYACIQFIMMYDYRYYRSISISIDIIVSNINRSIDILSYIQVLYNDMYMHVYKLILYIIDIDIKLTDTASDSVPYVVS